MLWDFHSLEGVAALSNVTLKGINMSAKASSKSTPMTTQAAARIQSSMAKGNGGQVQAGSFAARAQRAAATNQSATKGSK